MNVYYGFTCPLCNNEIKSFYHNACYCDDCDFIFMKKYKKFESFKFSCFLLERFRAGESKGL